MSSDEGDSIGQGKSYSFPVRAVTFWGDRSGLRVDVRARDHWSVFLAAPGGARLRERTYENALRFGDAVHPQLDVSGAGRGCNESTGRFTVHRLIYGAHDFLRSVRVTFEQHCEGRSPALRGEIDLVARRPPPPLRVAVTFARKRASVDAADGMLVLLGTIKCSQRVPGVVSANAREVGRQDSAVGSGSVSIAECSRTPTSWLLRAGSTNGIPFTSGGVAIEVRGEATDRYYTDYHGGSDPVAATDELKARVEVSPAPTPDPALTDVPPADGSAVVVVERTPTWLIILVLVLVAVTSVASALGTLVVVRRRSRPDA